MTDKTDTKITILSDPSTCRTQLSDGGSQRAAENTGAAVDKVSTIHPKMPRIQTTQLLSVDTADTIPTVSVVEDRKFGVAFKINNNIDLESYIAKLCAKGRATPHVKRTNFFTRLKFSFQSGKILQDPAEHNAAAGNNTPMVTGSTVTPSMVELRSLPEEYTDELDLQIQTKVLSISEPKALVGFQVILLTNDLDLVGVVVVLDVKRNIFGRPMFKIGAPEISDTWVSLRRLKSDVKSINFEVMRKV